MAHYSAEQIETLRKLRKVLKEKKFDIFDLRRSKHPLEFVAVDFRDAPFSAAIIRLYRGRVKIKFFYSISAWHRGIIYDLKNWFGEKILFDQKPWNPTRKGKYRPWYQLVKKGQLDELKHIGLSVSE